MSNPQEAEKRFVRLRSVFLLVALLAVILAIPLMAGHGPPGIFSRLFYTVVFCFAGYLLSAKGRWIIWYLALAVPTLLLGIFTSAYPDTRDLDIVRDVLTLALQVMLITVVLKFSLLDKEAEELDKVIAGICGYLILALLWADIYSLIEHFEPGSIMHSSGNPVIREDGSLVYFSMVTLTTLGYGDMAPAKPLARTFASLQAAAGTLYLAVLIASLLAGLRQSRSESN